jgi:hypothetical protein
VNPAAIKHPGSTEAHTDAIPLIEAALERASVAIETGQANGRVGGLSLGLLPFPLDYPGLATGRDLT